MVEEHLRVIMEVKHVMLRVIRILGIDLIVRVCNSLQILGILVIYVIVDRIVISQKPRKKI